MKKAAIAATFLLLITGFTAAQPAGGDQTPEQPEPDQQPEDKGMPGKIADKIPDISVDLPELPGQAAVSNVFNSGVDTVSGLVSGLFGNAQDTPEGNNTEDINPENA